LLKLVKYVLKQKEQAAFSSLSTDGGKDVQERIMVDLYMNTAEQKELIEEF